MNRIELDIHRTSLGREFNVVFPKHSPTSGYPQFLVITALSSIPTVHVTDVNSSTTDTYVLNSNKYKIISIPSKHRLELNGVSTKIINIIADHDISVAVYQGVPQLQDAYRALPVTAYGKQYVTVHYSTTSQPTSFAIVAIEDNTTVSILPPTSITYQAFSANSTTPLNIILNRLKVFYYATNANLTGTIITANKPIAVFGNNWGTKIPLDVEGLDYTVAQYPAIDYLDSKTAIYILTVFPGRANDTYRIVSLYGKTRVSIPSTSFLTTVDKAKFVEVTVSSSSPIQVLYCTPHCLVAHYSQGYSTDNTASDPSMTIAQSVGQFMSEYSISFLNETVFGFDTAYITVTIPKNERSNLRLDYATVRDINWVDVAINNYGQIISYSVGSINATKIRHLVHSKPVVKFGLLQYGSSGANGSYSLSGGYRFNATFRCKYAIHIFRCSHKLTRNPLILSEMLKLISLLLITIAHSQRIFPFLSIHHHK